MRKVFVTLLVTSAISAHAEDALISPGMPWSPGNPPAEDSFKQRQVGDIISTKQRQIFYITRKCDLQIVNAEAMREYTFDPSFGAETPLVKGCWGLTVDGNVVTIVPNRPRQSIAAQSLWKVDVRSDGTAKILRLHGLKDKP